MSVKPKEYGINLVFACDAPNCSQTADTNTHSFSVALDRIKKMNWVVYRVGENWRHNCPNH